MDLQEQKQGILLPKAKTTPSPRPPNLNMPIQRQRSAPTVSSLIAESISKPHSPPLVSSPEGAAQLKAVLQRLEQIEVESRDLLTELFSMVQTDARLEKYIKSRLEDPKVSRMWELAEQVLATQHGKMEIEKMLNDVEGLDDENAYVSSSSSSSDKGVKRSDEGGDDGLKTEWFKAKTFNKDEDVTVEEPVKPVPQN